MERQVFEQLVQRIKDASYESRSLEAVAELQRLAGEEEIPRLVELLQDDCFFVREAAAWPLSDLGVTAALPQLLEALEAGIRQRHDNDGLVTAIAGLVSAHPREAESVLREVASSGPEHLREHAIWALEFSEQDEDV